LVKVPFRLKIRLVPADKFPSQTERTKIEIPAGEGTAFQTPAAEARIGQAEQKVLAAEPDFVDTL
jgi:hypothetical protein